MIDQRRSAPEAIGDDLPDLAPCELLDEYWEELQHQSSADPPRWRDDRDSPEQRFTGDLGVLNLLHQLRRSEQDGNPSQARTLRLKASFGLVAEPPRANLDGPGLPECDEIERAPGSPSPASGGPTATISWPRRIGKYVVIELLDAGGQGQVFRVLHPELGKEYVLKLARRPTPTGHDAEAGQADRSSLRREGRLLAQCDHPNLVRVVDLDAHEGRLFVVMEHIPGLNLEQFSAQHRPGPRQAVRLIAELAGAVSYLHARGIIHQDIKPQNVLIDVRGRPRLIDFGLARHKHAWSSSAADAIGGTAAYMSPEQALGRDDRIGPCTDVFGLGGLLYHLLTGRPLYQGASRISVQLQAMKAEYVPIRQLNGRVPRSLERICRRALAADPEWRYHSTLELEHILRRFLARRWFALIGLAAVFLVGVAMIAQRLPAPRPELSSNVPSPPVRILIEALTIDHHGYRDGRWQWSIPIELSPRPVLEGDEAFVSARLDAPAYGYLIALNPDGKVQLCLPPDPSEYPRQSAEIRFEESTYFPFSDGPGLQVFIVLASRQPLPPYAHWSGSNWLAQHWRHIAADDLAGVWRHDGRAATRVSSVPRGPLQKRPGPPAPFDEVCTYLGTLPEIEAIQAIAFPVKSREAGKETRPPWQRVLQGEDAKRVEAMEKAVGELEKKGRFAEAVGPAREALAIRTRAQGEDHWETCNARSTEQTEIRMAALPATDQSRMASALLQKAEAERQLQQGRYADAEPLFGKTAEVCRRYLGEDDPRTASWDSDHSSTLYALGKYAQAETMVRSVLVRRRRSLGEFHPDTAQSCNDLGMTLDALGKPYEAEPFLTTALAVWRSILGENHPNTAIAYGNLAVLRCGQGRYAEAEPLLRSSLLISLRTLGEDHPDTAHGYNDLAGCLDHQGYYAEAESLLHTALASRRRALGEDHLETAQGYNNLAGCLNDQGRHVEAEPLLRNALAICRRTVGEDHLATAQSYNNLAKSLSARGKPAEAEPLFRLALAICRRTLGENELHTARSYGNLAGCLSAQGKHAEAEALSQTMLANCRRALGENHIQTAAGYGALARSLNNQGKYAEAETMALSAARSYEAARLGVSRSGLGRAEFARMGSPLSLAAALLARRGRHLDAWTYWESDLARGLFDDLEARRRRPLTGTERRRQEELAGRVDRLENQIGSLAAAGDLTAAQHARIEELKRERLEGQEQLAQFEADLAAKYQGAAGVVHDIKRIQAHLPADAALVGWLDLNPVPAAADPRGDHWACVVRHSGETRWIRIVGTGANSTWSQADQRRPDEVRRLLREPGSSAWREPLAELTEQRLAPLEPALGARDDMPAAGHLVILPSPALAGIPIEAMLEARPAAAPRYLVSYTPSGTMFAWLQEHRHQRESAPERNRRILALGDPVPFRAGEPKPPTSAANSTQHQIDALIRSSRGATFDPLPGTRREVEVIAALFDQRTVLLGSEASEQTLDALRRRGQLAQFDIIHLATHGRVDDLTPLNSRLLFSRDRLPDPMAVAPPDAPAYDGNLTAGEVMSTWKLNAELVTLSACRSGLGRQGGGEGFIGFAQAFFLAGSRSLLISLWEVDDRATSLLMTRFYQNWLGKRAGLAQPLSKTEALHEAKVWLRGLSSAEVQRELSEISRGEIRTGFARPAASHPFEHPHDWAGFILMGDPN